MSANYELDYQNGAYDLAGNVTGYRRINHAGGESTDTYVNTLGRSDGYRQERIDVTSTQSAAGSSTLSYDANGYLIKLTDSTQSGSDRTLINDAAGRALYVDQQGHKMRQLIVSGEVLGRFGVGLDEISPRQAGEALKFKPVADFGFGYQQISGGYPSGMLGTYTVMQGDTLRSIARATYGDEQLWYRLAEANGVGSDRELLVGQALSIPSGVGSSRNSAETFKPYDPSKITGDTSPNLPAPAASGGGDDCGGLGQILMIVVAVAVTWATYGALGPGSVAAWGAVEASAVAGAAGAAASQVVGNATGVIDGFDWKGIALGALGGAVTAGVAGNASALGVSGQSFGAVAARAAISNAMTQGIAVVSGLQKSFSWRGVAASAVGAGVGQSVGDTIGGGFDQTDFGPFAKGVLTGLAAGAAAAVMRGGRVSVTQVAVDAFGTAIGNALGDSIVAQSSSGSSGQTTYQDGDIGRSELRMSQPAQSDFPDLQQFVGAFGDGFVLPADRSNDTLLAAGDGFKMGGKPVLRLDQKFSDSEAQDMALVGMRHDIERDIARREAAAAAATERALRNMGDLAEAYRASGMTGATGDPLTFEMPQALAGSGLKPPSDGFFFGLSGGQRSVLDGTSATFAENAGLFARGVVTGPYTAAYGAVSELGSQYKDLYNLLGGTRENYSLSSGLFNSYVREGVGGTLLNMGHAIGSAPSQPIFDLLSGDYEKAGQGLPGTIAAGLGVVRSVGGLRVPAPLLPGEGNVASYRDLWSAGTIGDNLTGHHIPSANHMRQFGVSKDDGIAINMEQPYPGTGGRHRNTFTYGNNADVGMTSRDAMAAGVWDARRIYQRDGLYDPLIRGQLQELIKQNKAVYPELFRKPKP